MRHDRGICLGCLTLRVGAQDCHVGYEPTLEDAVLPQVGDIATRIESLLSY